MASAAASLKKGSLELGGKPAFLVPADAALGAACAMAAFNVVTHAGQGCAITATRMMPAGGRGPNRWFETPSARGVTRPGAGRAKAPAAESAGAPRCGRCARCCARAWGGWRGA